MHAGTRMSLTYSFTACVVPKMVPEQMMWKFCAALELSCP
jgi:hypothetical protein